MKKLLILLALTLTIGCVSGGTKYVETADGVLRMDTAAHTGVATQGATYTQFSKCGVDKTNCQVVGEHIGANPTMFEQLAGPAAAVGSAYLIKEGLSESGDEITNVNAQQQGQKQKQKARGGKGGSVYDD